MKLFLFAALFLLPLQASDPTLPPPSAQVRLTVNGLGVQIYRCTPQANNTFQWVFQAPEAKLLDRSTNEQLGTHGAGPTWTWNDGSSITGKVIQTNPSPTPGAIPWLLLETKPNSETTGVLTGITMVRRSETQAGTAPSYGCDLERVNTYIRVPYAAVYTFYSDSGSK
jgi:hypothetical protein